MSDHSLLDKLQHLVARFEEVSTLITDPSVIADMNRFVKLNKEYSDLQKIVEVRNRYKRALDEIEEARQILDSESDSDLRQMANEELSTNTEMLPALEEQIKLLLIPADPEDAKNVIMEIRGGTGGDEAAIFAGDLFKMYTKYCENKGWKCEVSSLTEGTSGGFKEIIFTVTGSDVYGTLKYESGVHRVQRVPQTETQGRVHTSAATVAVLPGGGVRPGLNPADIDFHQPAPVVRGGRTSTRWRQRYSSPTGPPASWWSASKPVRSSRTGNWPCRCCVPSSMTSSSPNDRVTSLRAAKQWSPQVTAPRRSAPTIILRDVLPTTASTTPTTSPPSWKAISRG